MAATASPTQRLTRRKYAYRSSAGAADARPRPGEPPARAVRRIVVTGGPGGGKSTAASFLAREFVDDLWVLPEAATLLYRAGLPRGSTSDGITIAQTAIYNMQRALEEANAVQHPRLIQLCDRGTLDGAAYWPHGSDAFFAAMGTTREQELARYETVIFLHTAASLPAGYERDLDVRTEEMALALDLDRRIFDLYRDHPGLVAISSSDSFFAKVAQVMHAVRASVTPSLAGCAARCESVG